ncbi:MAG TPA: exosortase/archaeosortase family protein [Verrucomicrobiae bacterium]|nr:exosortase/archaeosortase family protein [Verrucomicrobiae bacterium]
MNEAQTKAAPPDWQTDTVECWHRLPSKAFFFALLAAWALLFQFLGNSILGYVHTSSLFAWLYNAYNLGGEAGEDASIGNLIPFLVVGIFWWKRKELLALPLQIWWPGILMLAAALMLHMAGYVVQQPLLSVVALFAGIYALTGLAWGREWLKHSAYPFFLFVFSIPLTAHLNFILFPLQLFICWLVEMVAHIVGINVIRQGTQLMDPSGAYGYDVAAACAGMRSLIAVFLLATVYGFATFRSPCKRIFLLALALPFAVLGNMLRLLAIIVAAEMGGQSWGNYVHEGGPFGLISLLPYVPGIIGLLWVGRWLEKRAAKNKSAEKERA